jgi:hypothetical protein
MRVLLKTDGTTVALDRVHTMGEIAGLIGAKVLDTVSLIDGVHVMIVNDLGHKLQLPANNAATVHYHAKCRPGSNPPPILGDVVIVPDLDFAEAAQAQAAKPAGNPTEALERIADLAEQFLDHWESDEDAEEQEKAGDARATYLADIELVRLAVALAVTP